MELGRSRWQARQRPEKQNGVMVSMREDGETMRSEEIFRWTRSTDE